MKKLLFICMIAVSSLYAKPCMTDIYFGNGVWNQDEQETRTALIELRKLMLHRIPSSLNIANEGKIFDWKLAYNPSKGTAEDLIETFWQLKESGQISHGYFMGVFAAFSARASDTDPNALTKKLQHLVASYEGDVNTMFTLYKNASFDLKHNVLLVAHSQGNLFGNKMYTLMNDKQKEKFRMVSVATPASTSFGDLYVTARNDYVIGPIPGSLPGNVDGFGHTFLGTYLNMDGEGVIGDGSDTAPIVIASHVTNAYNNLKQSTTCSEYAFTRVWMLSFGVLNVYGNVDGKDELVGTVTLEQSDAILQDDNRTYRCEGGEDSFYWPEDNYGAYNWTFNYKDGNNNSWLPGQYITSRTYLDNISNTKDTVRKDTTCVTLSLEKDGELYTMIYDMFPE